MDNNLISADTILPALSEQNKQISEILSELKNLKETTTKLDNSPILIDYRKIDAFVYLQQVYYGIFARNQIALESVPFELVDRTTKWAVKNFKKDLRTQVVKSYKKLISEEKRIQRKKKFKSFFDSVFHRKKKTKKVESNSAST